MMMGGPPGGDWARRGPPMPQPQPGMGPFGDPNMAPPPYGHMQPKLNSNQKGPMMDPKMQKAGMPEKFNELKAPGSVGKAQGGDEMPPGQFMSAYKGLQTTPSPQLMNYVEFEGQELTITKQLNLSFKGGAGGDEAPDGSGEASIKLEKDDCNEQSFHNPGGDDKSLKLEPDSSNNYSNSPLGNNNGGNAPFGNSSSPSSSSNPLSSMQQMTNAIKAHPYAGSKSPQMMMGGNGPQFGQPPNPLSPSPLINNNNNGKDMHQQQMQNRRVMTPNQMMMPDNGTPPPPPNQQQPPPPNSQQPPQKMSKKMQQQMQQQQQQQEQQQRMMQEQMMQQQQQRQMMGGPGPGDPMNGFPPGKVGPTPPHMMNPMQFDPMRQPPPHMMKMNPNFGPPPGHPGFRPNGDYGPPPGKMMRGPMDDPYGNPYAHEMAGGPPQPPPPQQQPAQQQPSGKSSRSSKKNQSQSSGAGANNQQGQPQNPGMFDMGQMQPGGGNQPPPGMYLEGMQNGPGRGQPPPPFMNQQRGPGMVPGMNGPHGMVPPPGMDPNMMPNDRMFQQGMQMNRGPPMPPMNQQQFDMQQMMMQQGGMNGPMMGGPNGGFGMGDNGPGQMYAAGMMGDVGANGNPGQQGPPANNGPMMQAPDMLLQGDNLQGDALSLGDFGDPLFS